MSGIKLDPPRLLGLRLDGEYGELLRDVGVDDKNGDHVVQADEVDPAVGVTFDKLKRAARPDGKLQLPEPRSALANSPLRGALLSDTRGQDDISNRVERATMWARAADQELGRFSVSGNRYALTEALRNIGEASAILRGLHHQFIRREPLGMATVGTAGRLRRIINTLSARLGNTQGRIHDAVNGKRELLERYEMHRSTINAVTSKSIGAALPPLLPKARSQHVRGADPQKEVKKTLMEGAERLLKARREGVWTTPYEGGPLHSAVSLIAMNFIGAPDVADEHHRILSDLLNKKRKDGGFPITLGQKGSKAATRIVRLAFESALKREDGAVAKDPLLRAQLERAIKSCNKFINTAKDTVEAEFNTQMANVLEDTVDPDKYDSAPNSVSDALRMRDYIKWGHDCFGMSPQVVNGSRAMLLLGLHQAEKQSGSPPDAKAHDSLASQLKASQDEDGAWMYITSFTGLSLMALKLEGEKLDAPVMAKGMEFLRRMNKKPPDPDVRPVISWIAATTWDTGVIFDTIARIIGPSRTREIREATLKAILKGQLKDGRWAFTLTGSEGGKGVPSMGDNDTTGAMVRVLSSLYRDASGEERERIGGALRRAALALAHEQQQKDGGFGAFGPRQMRSFGSKPPGWIFPLNYIMPGPLESMVNDASSPDVTGRVLTGLLAVSQTGELKASEQADVDKAIERALGYLHEARDKGTGMWWNRWIAGQLPSAAFVLPPLRALGVVPGDPMITKARAFLLEHQNSDDGGWGETIAADSDPTLAGKGPSTPVQTAFAVLGLISTMKEEDEEAQRALDRAVRYLLKHRDGTKWKNGRPLYTMSTGLEYNDAGEMTSAMVLTALQAYDDFRRYGAERTIRRLTFGPGGEAPN
jgi:squalene cyclase